MWDEKKMPRIGTQITQGREEARTVSPSFDSVRQQAGLKLGQCLPIRGHVLSIGSRSNLLAKAQSSPRFSAYLGKLFAN